MPPTKLSKSQLRKTLRQRRQGLGPAEQLAAARAMALTVTELAHWPQAECLGLYLAADGEIDTAPLCELCRALDKQLFLPVIQADNSLTFATWQADSPLVANRYGIPEPSAQARSCPVETLDILFLPLVGWDRQGGRLGMGGGFYDRTLSGASRPLLVGLAHAGQEVDHVPRDDWDIPLDFIATDQSLHRRGSAG